MPSASPTPLPNPVDPGSGADPGLRIAVVEDDPLHRRLLLKLLRTRFQPADLREFSRGKPCRDECLRDPPDILIADLRLPDLDGREIIRALRAAGLTTRVIVLTSQVNAQLPDELVALGVEGLVDKAGSLECVEQAVTRKIRGHK